MKSPHSLFLVLGMIGLTAILFSSPLYATDGIWIGVPSSGYAMDWSDPATWENGIIANGIGATATFRPDTDYIICTLDTPVTLGHWVFESAGSYCDYRLDDNPWQRVQLATTDGTPSITVNSHVTVEFYFPLSGSQGLDKFGAGSLELSGGANYTGVTTVHAGSLEVWADNSLGVTGVGNETVVLSGGNLTIAPYDAAKFTGWRIQS